MIVTPSSSVCIINSVHRPASHYCICGGLYSKRVLKVGSIRHDTSDRHKILQIRISFLMFEFSLRNTFQLGRGRQVAFLHLRFPICFANAKDIDVSHDVL